MPVRRTLAAAACSALLWPSLAACADDDPAGSATPTPPASSAAEPTPTDTPSLTESAAPAESETPEDEPTLSVTIVGDEVSPNAQELTVEPGETLHLEIESDRAGEFHVHAKPEQYLEFEAGTTQAELTIETPGSVEIEEHESGAVVAILEVR
jgi:hypothetical protein